MIAIYIAFLPKIQAYVDKPILKIEFENNSPFCRLAKLTNENIDAYHIRLRVKNIGNSIAKKCEAHLDKITWEGFSTNWDPEKAIDPMSLHWVDSSIEQVVTLDNSTKYTRYNKYIDIPPGGYQYFDLFYTTNKGYIYLFPTDEKPRGFSFSLGIDNYTFHITIYSENAKLTKT